MTGDNGRQLTLFARSLVGGGGAERVVVNLAEALAARGHRVDLVLWHRKGVFLDAIAPGVTVVDLGAPSVFRALPSLLTTPADFLSTAPALAVPGGSRVLGAVPALARYLAERRPDALLSALNYSNVAAVIAKGLVPDVGTRIAVSMHNHLTTSVAEAASLVLVPGLARRFFPRADRVVAVSRGVADDLARVTGIPRRDIHVIYNPVVTPAIESAAREDPGHPWLAPGEPPVVLAAGKLKKQKDFPTLVRAFARLRAARPARLVILGDGLQRRKLLALAASLGVARDVELPGFVANPFALMSRAAVFVLSSAWEGFGNVLVEAMACGCPVVSTDCPSGPSEILEGGVHGSLVPVGDDAALASAIARVLDEPPDRAALRKRAGDFTAARAAALYERVLLDGDAARADGGARDPT